MPAAKKAAPTAPAKAAPAKATSSKTVAKIEPKTTALAGVPDEFLSDMLRDAGAGLEHATAQDYALPFIYLLQKMSPQVDKDQPERYLEGAEPGMFLNTVTGELFEELNVIPVEFQKVFIEWIPRDAGGGFVSQYNTRADADKNCAEGHQIVDTANHFVLLWSPRDETWTQAIISMTSTKLKASRNWVSRMGAVTIPTPDGGKKVAPTYARYYKVLPDGPMKNEKGTYYIVKVEAVEGEEGWVKDANLREQAKDFRASLQANRVGVDYTKAGEVTAEIVDEEGTPTY